jgi:hypothetical protein
MSNENESLQAGPHWFFKLAYIFPLKLNFIIFYNYLIIFKKLLVTPKLTISHQGHFKWIIYVKNDLIIDIFSDIPVSVRFLIGVVWLRPLEHQAKVWNEVEVKSSLVPGISGVERISILLVEMMKVQLKVFNITFFILLKVSFDVLKVITRTTMMWW